MMTRCRNDPTGKMVARLIPIGRFSKMTRLSAKALRLYDDIGLLLPARVEPSTGYRYYTLDQAVRAATIRSLRSVEMPLDEIRAFIDADTDSLANERLIAHKLRLEKRLVAHERMLADLDVIIENKPNLLPYEVQVTSEAEKRIAAVRIHTSSQRIARDIAQGFETLVQGLRRKNVVATGAPMLIYHDVIDEESDGDIEIAVPVDATFSSDGDVYGRIVEACKMATIVHRGPFTEIAPVYHKLADWIHEQGFDIAGPPREVYLSDPKIVASEDLLTRVEFPVCSGRDQG